MALRCDDSDEPTMVALWLILEFICSGDTVESENFLPITNCHIISSSPRSTFKASNYKMPHAIYHYLETNGNIPSVSK